VPLGKLIPGISEGSMASHGRAPGGFRMAIQGRSKGVRRSTLLDFRYKMDERLRPSRASATN
jgi:hypothetical protein